jgi:hypothetical protein
MRRLLVTGNAPTSTILVTLMMEANLPPKRRFLQEPHGNFPEDGILRSLPCSQKQSTCPYPEQNNCS